MLLLCGDDTKNGKTRRVALSGALVALLQAQASRGVSEWVFPGRDGVAKPIDNLTKLFTDAEGGRAGKGADSRPAPHPRQHVASEWR